MTAGRTPGPLSQPSGLITARQLQLRRLIPEASGRLVVPLVFKTSVAEHLGQAGSIPVRLRHI